MIENRKGLSFYTDNIGPPYIKCSCGAWIRTKMNEWTMMPLLGKSLVLAKILTGVIVWSMIGAVLAVALTDWAAMEDARDTVATLLVVLVLFIHIRYMINNIKESKVRMGSVDHSESMRVLSSGDTSYMKRFVK